MRRLKILHSADFHFDREHQEPSLASLEAFLAFGREQRVDLWVLAGDLFNRAVQNTGSSGFPRLIRLLQAMMNIAPIVAVRGTPTHDLPGCYESLQQIHAAHRFTLLDSRDRLAFLTAAGEVESVPRREEGPLPPQARLLILGCPEPSPDWLPAAADGAGGGPAGPPAAGLGTGMAEGMRRLLREWGAWRRRNADLPCLFVFHGLVSGATLQNGQIVGRGEVAIGRRDLAAVGADYYALGHVHLAQRIAGLPAWYPGSAFPVNWGERDAKTFQFIRMGGTPNGFAAEVRRIAFPHPPRRKLTLPPDGRIEEDLAGCQVWLEVPVTRESAAGVDRRALLERLHALGAVPGSRVSLLILPSEAVREARIREVHRLEEKVQVWAAAAEEELPPGVAARARELEAEARREGASPAGLHIRIRRLRLRGAIGIWKGQGVREIALDLDRYTPDLIALVGPNGSGKSTLIENMHPFPEMLTRSGKLQDHFFLRDSFRDLTFTDERTGDAYRALLRVDGRNPSGRVEYHLFRNGQTLSNGRREDYLERIQELFGSLSLFLRSAFISQKPNRNHPDLAEATKGEKKALFRELAGLEYLQGYAEAAREKARALEEEIGREQARAELLQPAVAVLAEKERLRRERAQELAGRREELAAVEEQLARLRAERRELEEAERRSLERRARLEELGRQAAALLAEKRALQEQAEGGPPAGRSREETEGRLAELEELKKREEELLGRKARILEAREAASAGYRAALEDSFRQQRLLEQRAEEIRRRVRRLRERKSFLEGRIAELEPALRLEVACPRCGHAFCPHRERGEAGLAACRAELRRIERSLAGQERRLASLAGQADRLEAPPPLPFSETLEVDRQLAEIRDRLAQLPQQDLRSVLAKAFEAGGRLLEAQRRIARLDGQILELEESMRRLDGVADGREGARSARVEAALREMEARREEVIQEIARGEQALLQADEEIGALGAQAERLQALRQGIDRRRREVAEWQLLERACGPDGIQALELDAMGPGIAEVANRLLQAAYGSRFQIEFRTTRLGGAGSRRRQIEDFQIWIFDLESGTEQLLETLSGGEAVWVKRAICDAFGIIRDRSTGQRFLTVFQDEADGALDPQARLAYFQMLREAHRESGRVHTIVITHSQEAQEMIPQRISIRTLPAGAEGAEPGETPAAAPAESEGAARRESPVSTPAPSAKKIN